MEDEQSLESQIKRAMNSRGQHFISKSDTLTFEGVRRLLEKDMGLDEHALDVHKKFVRKLLGKCLEGNNDENESKNPGETLVEMKAEPEKLPKKEEIRNEQSIENEEKMEDSLLEEKKKEAEQSPKKEERKNEQSIENEEEMEDSPVMGLLSPSKLTKSEKADNQTTKKKNKIPSETKIKKAMWNRADYFKANAETITMAGVRRMLEEEFGLDIKSLDPMKEFINFQLEEVLSCETTSEANKKSTVNSRTKNASKKTNSGESSDSESEEELKSKKKVVQKGKVRKTEGLIKKRKAPVKETKMSNKKQKVIVQKKSKESNEDDEDGGNVSEDSNSISSAEKPVKKKEVASAASTPAYGKKVEHLKSVIKSCGITIPPVIYRKAKQVPELKRESFVIRELEDILSKEGLSANPSEKEIKDVKKKKERAKELEGIDTSNIVLSSRRRSTTSFIPPPKTKITVESSSDDEEDEEESESNSDDDDASNDEAKDDADDDVKDDANDDVKDNADDDVTDIANDEDADVTDIANDADADVTDIANDDDNDVDDDDNDVDDDHNMDETREKEVKEEND